MKFLLPLLLLSFRLFAQPETQIRFNKVDGLSQSTGFAITKDRQGFLWIATANGLNRYDGMEMKVYKPELEEKEKGMEGRIIRSELLEDENERLWFATDVTVHCFDKRKEIFTRYDLTKKTGAQLSSHSLDKGIFGNPFFHEGPHVWFATINKGLFELNTNTNESINYPLLLKDEANNPIQLMYNGVYDHKDKFWFASNKGLLSFNKITNQWQRFFQDKAFYTVSFCDDTLFLSEGKEILKVDIARLSYDYAKFNETENKNSFERDVIHKVYTDKQFDTWMGDEKGNVYCKRLHAPAFKWMGNINIGGMVKTNYPVYCFYADSSGILWTGAYMLGLLKTRIDQQEFNTFPQTSPNKVVENVFVNAIYEDENDKVWLGTFQKGILILDKKTGTTSSVKLPYAGPQLIYGNSVHKIYKDSRGNLWTGISGYLFVKEKGANSFTSIQIPSPSNALQYPQVWSFSEFKDGWLFGTTIGLYSLKKENNNYDVKYLSGFGQTRIMAIWNNQNQEAWIAFESEGLAIIKDPDQIIKPQKLFIETNVKSFYNDQQHQLLWISTSSGLIAYHLTSGKYKYFAEKDGLLNSYVFGVLPDNDKLWISTNYGLFRSEIFFKKDSVLPIATFTNFTSTDGLPDNQFNNWAFYKGQSGNLYFATAKGLVWFKPAAIRPDLDIPKLRMINLLANEEKTDELLSPGYIKDLVLPYFKNSLFFRFRGIEFNNANKINYMYKLERWDKDWIYSGQLNEVRYSNLPDGKYIFKFKASNSSGIWSNDEYAVAITIKTPFWKTWWFYSLAFILVTGTIILVTRYISQNRLKEQIRELEKQKALEQERLRISREMHDDLGAGLTQITLMSESARHKTQVRELEDIAGTSRKLVNNMSEIIWSLHPENKTLEQLCSYLREELNKQLEYSEIDYAIHLPEGRSDIILSNDQRRNILLVTREIVNNAIKYSKAKNITIEATYINHKLIFEVIDNGNGFDSSKTYSGNGLRNIRQRIEELNGQLIINSSVGSGSKFMYSIPLN